MLGCMYLIRDPRCIAPVQMEDVDIARNYRKTLKTVDYWVNPLYGRVIGARLSPIILVHPL